MKYSIAAIAAMATVAVAKPEFTESSFPDLKEGATVKLGFDKCQSKCTIILQDGDSGNLKDVKTLTTDATGESVEVTLPSKLPSAKYAFLIKDNGETDSNEWNYSTQFEVEGTGSASSSASESSATKTDESSTTEASSTETESKTESETKTDSETSSATETASKTHKSHASTTSTETAAPSTDAPNSNNAGSLSSRLSPLALIAGGAAAMLFLS